MIQSRNGSIYLLHNVFSMAKWNFDRNEPKTIPELTMPPKSMYNVETSQNGIGFLVRQKTYLFKDEKWFIGKSYPLGGTYAGQQNEIFSKQD